VTEYESVVNFYSKNYSYIFIILHFAFTCSHTPRTTGRGGGTGLLISKDWKFDLQPAPTGNGSFESHAVTVTHPVKIHFVLIYRPPGQLGKFLEELDVLLSNYLKMVLLWYCLVTSTST